MRLRLGERDAQPVRPAQQTGARVRRHLHAHHPHPLPRPLSPASVGRAEGRVMHHRLHGQLAWPPYPTPLARDGACTRRYSGRVNEATALGAATSVRFCRLDYDTGFGTRLLTSSTPHAVRRGCVPSWSFRGGGGTVDQPQSLSLSLLTCLFTLCGVEAFTAAPRLSPLPSAKHALLLSCPATRVSADAPMQGGGLDLDLDVTGDSGLLQRRRGHSGSASVALPVVVHLSLHFLWR